MFHHSVIAVGRMKNPALARLADDYAGRLARSGRLEVVELKDGDLATEGRRIAAALDKRPGARLFVLAEEGRTLTSRGFAEELDGLRGAHAVFVVGGAHGIDPAVKRRADRLWSLSPLTFTHEIARVLLLEQLYRAESIRSGSGYHHD